MPKFYLKLKKMCVLNTPNLLSLSGLAKYIGYLNN